MRTHQTLQSLLRLGEWPCTCFLICLQYMLLMTSRLKPLAWAGILQAGRRPRSGAVRATAGRHQVLCLAANMKRSCSHFQSNTPQQLSARACSCRCPMKSDVISISTHQSQIPSPVVLKLFWLLGIMKRAEDCRYAAKGSILQPRGQGVAWSSMMYSSAHTTDTLTLRFPDQGPLLQPGLSTRVAFPDVPADRQNMLSGQAAHLLQPLPPPVHPPLPQQCRKGAMSSIPCNAPLCQLSASAVWQIMCSLCIINTAAGAFTPSETTYVLICNAFVACLSQCSVALAGHPCVVGSQVFVITE